jgi:hypothetical protein
MSAASGLPETLNSDTRVALSHVIGKPVLPVSSVGPPEGGGAV